MERMREEFEAWVVSALGCDVADISKDEHGVYNSFQTGNLYVAWIASRKALCVKLPSSWYQDWDGYILNREDDVKSCLDDAGVRYE